MIEDLYDKINTIKKSRFVGKEVVGKNETETSKMKI